MAFKKKAVALTQNFNSAEAETFSEGITVMVYCLKCGEKNEEDAKFCVKCGTALHAEEKKEKWGDTCFGRPEKRVEEECFGLPHGGAIFGLFIGALIILWGLIWILQQLDILPPTVEIWPFAVIFIGVLIIAGVIYSLRRYKG